MQAHKIVAAHGIRGRVRRVGGTSEKVVVAPNERSTSIAHALVERIQRCQEFAEIGDL